MLLSSVHFHYYFASSKFSPTDNSSSFTQTCSYIKIKRLCRVCIRWKEEEKGGTVLIVNE